jgi:hypothetical protein
MGKVTNVGYWSRNEMMEIILVFNLGVILQTKNIFPFLLSPFDKIGSVQINSQGAANISLLIIMRQ